MDTTILSKLEKRKLTHVLTNCPDNDSFQEIAVEIMNAYYQKTENNTTACIYTNKHFEELKEFLDDDCEMNYISRPDELTNYLFLLIGRTYERFELLEKTKYSCLDELNEDNKLDFPTIYFIIDDYASMKNEKNMNTLLWLLQRSLPINFNFIVNDTSGNLKQENEELYNNLITKLTIEGNNIKVN